MINVAIILKICEKDSEAMKSKKYIFNAAYRENEKRNFIQTRLNKAKNNDDDIYCWNVLKTTDYITKIKT